MNEYIAELSNLFSLQVLKQRSLLEIALILMPTLLLVMALFGYFTLVKTQFSRWTISMACLLLIGVYMPYELMRQSTDMSRAQVNVDEIHAHLQTWFDTTDLDHISTLNNKAVAGEILDELSSDLDARQKKELIMISWLMAENEKQALDQLGNKQHAFADEIKTSVSTARDEIIDAWVPIETISGNVIEQIGSDVNYLLDDKMATFKQKIDKTLDGFEGELHTFIQTELNHYEEKLAEITQRNADELKKYSDQAGQTITQHMSRINAESIEWLEGAQTSLGGIDKAIGDIDKTLVGQIGQLAAQVEMTQKRNDLVFAYHECIRSVGFFDLSNEKAACKAALDEGLSDL